MKTCFTWVNLNCPKNNTQSHRVTKHYDDVIYALRMLWYFKSKQFLFLPKIREQCLGTWAFGHLGLWALGALGTRAFGLLGLWALGPLGTRAFGHLGTWDFELLGTFAYCHSILGFLMAGFSPNSFGLFFIKHWNIDMYFFKSGKI